MVERVVFYQLTHKFVNQEKDIPEDSQQVIYYSLAIGHHVGVMDCFQKLIEVSVEDYRQWLTHLPEGTGRRKLAGVLKWGEIEINRSHASDLLPVLQGVDAADIRWADTLIHCLKKMMEEPALYLMVRKIS